MALALVIAAFLPSVRARTSAELVRDAGEPGGPPVLTPRPSSAPFPHPSKNTSAMAMPLSPATA